MSTQPRNNSLSLRAESDAIKPDTAETDTAETEAVETEAVELAAVIPRTVEADAKTTEQFETISKILPADAETVDFSVVLSSFDASWSDYSAAIVGTLNRKGWPKEDIFSTEMAVAEAIVNGVKHGNRYDRKKNVRAACRVSDDALVIVVTDEGNGFDVKRVADPRQGEGPSRMTGRGIFIINHYMTEARHNETGNELILIKRRSDV